MKKNMKLLGLIPALLFAIGCEGKQMNEVNVIIISGQSNAVGCKASENLLGTKYADKYNQFQSGFDDVKISYNNWTVDNYVAKTISLQNASPRGDFVSVKLGQGNVPANFGMEVGIADALHEKFGNKLYIIKCPCGGSNLIDYFLTPEDSMHQNLINFVTKCFEKLEKSGLNPKLRAFLWNQGEGDSYSGYYQAHFEALKQFKENLDRELLKYTSDNVLPFIDAGILPGTKANGDPTWEFYAQVNQFKQQFAALSPTNIYIDAIANGLHANQEPNDVVHYDSESVVDLGYLYAAQLEQFLK